MRTDLLVNNFTQTAFKNKKLNIFEVILGGILYIQDIVNVFVFAIKNFNKLKGESYNVGLSTANISKTLIA